MSLHCIVLFPLRAPASWRSTKCTRRLFKVWRNWPNSKLICYSQRGERRLSFEYKFVGHSWKLLKLYPSVHPYFFFCLYTVLYCFHWKHQQVEGLQSAHGGSLRYEGIGQIQNWYVILKEENLGFHLNTNLSAIHENLSNYTHSVHSYFFFCLYTVLYCFHWEHQQVEGVQSVHGGSLRYEGIGQIQNWYVILKEENVGFHLNINLSAILENFLNYTQVYINISFFVFTLYCIVSTESTSKLKECKVHTEAL